MLKFWDSVKVSIQQNGSLAFGSLAVACIREMSAVEGSMLKAEHSQDGTKNSSGIIIIRGGGDNHG